MPGFDPTDGFLVRKVRKILPEDEEGDKEALNKYDDDIIIHESEPSGPVTQHGVEDNDDKMQTIGGAIDDEVSRDFQVVSFSRTLTLTILIL